MPQVASDPIVQRPLRPEPQSARAGAPAGHSFEALLDTSDTPRNTRPARAARTGSSEPSDRARETDNDKSAVKPADKPGAPPVKGAEQKDQASDVSQPNGDATDRGPQIAVVSPELLAAVTDAVAAPKTDDSPAVPVTDTKADGTTPKADDDAAAVVAQAAAVPAVAAAVAVAVAAPVPSPAPATPVARPADDAARILAVSSQAATPAVPAESAVSDAIPAEAKPAKVDAAHTVSDEVSAKDGPEKSGQPEKTPADELKSLTPKTAGAADSADTKSARADHKSEAGNAKTAEHPGTRAAEAHAPPDTSPRNSDAPEQPGKPAAALHAQAAEHASSTARANLAEPRELPSTAAAPAQLNAATPPPPFSLTAPPMPLANPLPVTALRVDSSADNAVPVAGLAVEIVSRAQDGLRRFDIRLDPPELGRIDVRLDVDSAGKVTSHLTVERAETLDLLRRDAPQLERALQHAGLNTDGGLEFSLRDQNFANRDQGPRDLPVTRLIVPDDEPAAAEAARRGYGRLIGLGGGVDIKV